MVPQHKDPPGEDRPLSPEIQRQLESAMRAFAKDETASKELLREALESAATDAKQRGLRAEDLVIAFKATEAQVPELARRDDSERSAIRLRMIRAMLDVYYR
jgi:hypothetical protein